MARIKNSKSVVQEVVVRIECDNCSNYVNASDSPDGWLCFSSYHYDWGNDSIESHEWHDACSPECFFANRRTTA